MQVEINSNGEKGTARKRAGVPRTAGLLMASWAILGSSAHAEVLYEKDGIQLLGTARIITCNAATCHVSKANATAERYQELKEKDHKGALETMDRIVALQKEHSLTLPEEFPFQYAKAALAASVRREGPTADAGGRQRVQSQTRERLPFEPEMVEIPDGSFRMGCVSGRDCHGDEHPVHSVRVERFELSKYEVTFEQYDRFTAATGRARASDEGWGRGRRPVINVSWEYAARAGTATAYGWGNEIGRNRGNCDGCGSQWDNRQTAPVGSFSPNSWGLHDMHGNVWEWVQDRWNGSYRDAPADGSAWESGSCSQRVLRGGSWGFRPRLLRSATGSPPRFGTSTSGSAWPGRLPLESLNLYLLRGSRGQSGENVTVPFSPLLPLPHLMIRECSPVSASPSPGRFTLLLA